ncbi:hypothetical protein MRX96_056242 [Rhipicephalus microplus]
MPRQLLPAVLTAAGELRRPAGATNAAPRRDLKQTQPKATLAASSSVPEQAAVTANPSSHDHIPSRATEIGAILAPIHDGMESPGSALPPHKKHHRPRGVRRPTDLPMLRLRKFVLGWAPMRIIGLLRPQPARPRRAPTLRELLLEVQKHEQDDLNRFTKERQRQLIVVLVIGVLLVYFMGVVGAYVYYETKEQTAATPGCGHGSAAAREIFKNRRL